MSGLKLTKAAILAYLKKNRKPLQVWEANKNLKKGIVERNYLQSHPTVRASMGLGPRGNPDTPIETFLRITLPETKSAQKVLGKLTAFTEKKRRKVTRAAKKFRKKGGKLSEYKGKNPVYAKVDALRKLKAKQEKKTGIIY